MKQSKTGRGRDTKGQQARRSFLKSAALGGSAVMIGTTAQAGRTASPVSKKSAPDDPLHEILARCGSEFGDIRRID